MTLDLGPRTLDSGLLGPDDFALGQDDLKVAVEREDARDVEAADEGAGGLPRRSSESEGGWRRRRRADARETFPGAPLEIVVMTFRAVR